MLSHAVRVAKFKSGGTWNYAGGDKAWEPFRPFHGLQLKVPAAKARVRHRGFWRPMSLRRCRNYFFFFFIRRGEFEDRISRRDPTVRLTVDGKIRLLSRRRIAASYLICNKSLQK